MRNYLWPIGIFVAMALFMGMTLMFVKKAFSERVDLVAPDYYYKDKVFSERLAQENALLKLGAAAVTRRGEGVQITLPGYFVGKRVKGSVHFYSPLNPAEDFTLPLEFVGISHELRAKVDKSHIWKISFTFESEGSKYYLQSTVP